MLDVLVPVAEAIHAAVSGSTPSSQALAQVKIAASTGLAATALLPARWGRAAVLGERSVGRLDPGAQSACLLVHAVCDTLSKE
jgi:dihydroxyacetone kinase-like protein